ncbi:phosphoribosylglycinamide formyltransferase [Aerococcus agrisoli]|uniref:Phosphoribosylglycinamide formyltransferase n=1 Tax=Aerococcus agrisoli TaxID=2487350 RepID=A0A3N4GSI5_9LACT|nr:phosphoribosylglycinamide formyltransferase [Aerococcus agrisoli]RPA63646.1 phosphoribosylglycinamide formyltransferase [Aerococcus agrisoli]
MKLGLMASGNGTNVQAIIDAVSKQEISGQISCIVTDNPKAYVIERAKKAGIPYLLAQPKAYDNRQAWEEAIVTYLRQQGVDLVVLAGFMRIVGQPLLDAFPNSIINIHPALLPAFPGRDGIGDAYKAKVSQTGVTVHYVDEGIDTGEIIAQESLTIEADWTLDDLAAHIHDIEHDLYPKVIEQLIQNQK